MSNVLTPEALDVVRSFYRTRFVLVGSLAGIACGFVVLLALVPAYTIVSAERASRAESPQTISSSPPSTEREDIVRAQMLVKELRPVASSTPSALEILDVALGARPARVTVSSMSYTRGDPGTIVLGGVAPSRDEINAYRMVLAKDPRFKSVSVPIGILTGASDGRFTITLTGSF